MEGRADDTAEYERATAGPAGPTRDGVRGAENTRRWLSPPDAATQRWREAVTSTATSWRERTARMGQWRPRTPEQVAAAGPLPRQARLTLRKLDPWSVLKFSFVLALACFVIFFVAVAVLYGLLSAFGVFSSIQHAVANVTSAKGSAGVNTAGYFSAATILPYTALVGAFGVVMMTVLATVGSLIYNLVAYLVGGIDVTLRETE